MNYAFLKSLLTQAEAFEQQTPATEQQTLASFAAWLSQQTASAPAVNSAGVCPPDDHELLAGSNSPDHEIGIFVSYLYRYTKLYGKKALADTPLSTIDEFSYMVMLLEGTAPTKTELIDRNIQEKTTGTEILRRLINGGLVEQFDDPTDRRSKRLKLTEQGMSVMFQVMPRMGQLLTLVGGNLTPTEKEQLVFLLSKLHLFHNQLFNNERDTPIEVLVSQLEDSKN
jgi:MarR family transcriptional regulator, lower aerobic nicotinate degradation pathway regulator